MMQAHARREESLEGTAYTTALLAAIAARRVEIQRSAEAQRGGCSGENRLGRLNALILALAAMVPNDVREANRCTLAEVRRGRVQMRGGPIYDNVIKLLPERCEWTIHDAITTLKERRVEATTKAVQNVFGYLARAGKVQRVERGRYLVDGALIVTASDLGGEPVRYEGD